MKYGLLSALVFAVGCSGSPVAPTPITPPVSVTPPVVTPPATNPLLSDPQFNLGFYRVFALGFDQGQVRPLRRQAQAPSIYLYTLDQAGNAVDARTLDSTAAALISAAGPLAGGLFGLSGIDRGPGPVGPNQIAIVWSPDANINACGSSEVGGRAMTLFYKVVACQCGGVIRPLTVKHELGHVMGYYHTGDAADLMSGLSVAGCDMNPSQREAFHARVAYSQPIGSLEP